MFEVNPLEIYTPTASRHSKNIIKLTYFQQNKKISTFIGEAQVWHIFAGL